MALLPVGPPPLGGRTVQDGDLVIAYERHDSMKAVRVDSKKGQLQNRHGNFAHRDWVGKAFGSKVFGRDGRGFVYLLAPTPELWTQVLKHRTQILYAGDISLICFNLELCPGATVLESGTGSGSLTTSLCRAVGPTGRVHTFEFHEERARIAAEEFKGNGLGNVEVTHRNIEEDGFPHSFHGQVDAIFLDLPGPWKVVPSAAACLLNDGIFCSFSPCIEQVQRTCEALTDNNFGAIKTVEILLRYHRVEKQVLTRDLDAFDSSTLRGREKQTGGKGKGKRGQGGAGSKRGREEEGGAQDGQLYYGVGTAEVVPGAAEPETLVMYAKVPAIDKGGCTAGTFWTRRSRRKRCRPQKRTSVDTKLCGRLARSDKVGAAILACCWYTRQCAPG